MTIYEMIRSGNFPTPKSAATLGFELLEYFPEKLEIHVAFNGKEIFTNLAGQIQGGFICAMLDDVMGPALLFSLPPTQFVPTLELKTQFLKPVMPGRIKGKGRVVSKGKQICYLEGELFQHSNLVARATATALIRTVHPG